MTPDEAVTPPVSEKLPPALVEVATASRKPLQFVAQNRRKVEEMLLTLPELGGDKALAARLAYIVWDQQGEVRLKKHKLRAAYIEELLNTKRSPRAKAVADAPAQVAGPGLSLAAEVPMPAAPFSPNDEPDLGSKPVQVVGAVVGGDVAENGNVAETIGRVPEVQPDHRSERLL